MPRIRVKTGPNKGFVFPIGDEVITLGRDNVCSIQILDKGASRRHSEIFRVGEMCFIRDLESRNGTFVNDQPVKEDLLREGDRMQIGGTVLVFESGGRVMGETKHIDLSAAASDDEMAIGGQTLELRLDDLEEPDEAEHAESRDSANFRAVYRLGQILNAEQAEGALVEKALDFLREAVHADTAYLFIRDEIANTLVPRAFRGEHEEPSAVSRTIIRRAVAERRAILTTDALSDARFRGGESVILNRIHSVICVPFISTGKVTGALYLDSARVDEGFVEEDLELATAAGAQMGLAIDNLESHRRQRETFLSTVRTLSAVTEMRDPSTRGHSERVASYAAAIAAKMELSDRERADAQLAALLHDIGKAALSDQAREGLTEEERAKRHVELGADLARNIVGSDRVMPAIRGHHERHDGSGYPEGLKEEEIPLLARIVGLANAFDHLMTEGGDLGEGLAMKDALVAVGETSGKTYHPDAVTALLVAYRDGTLFSPKTIFDDEETSAG